MIVTSDANNFQNYNTRYNNDCNKWKIMIGTQLQHLLQSRFKVVTIQCYNHDCNKCYLLQSWAAVRYW